uniref:Uncharacterized protein n=1 Tax=Arundo donax TaxID=35708 RepID=A0A0A8Z595_ARUDO
MKGGVPMI